MIGEMIAHYRIKERLSLGTLGEAWKAEDTRLQRTVILKLLPAELSQDQTAKKRFLNEAKAAGSLDHPNIASVHEIGETGEGQLYVVMGWQEGESLQGRLSRGPLKVAEALAVATDVARGLGAAHAQGMVHRDISPRSIWVGQEGGAKLVDFGVAKLAGSERLTRTGTTVGSVGYMSPEQLKGKDADTRSDIWGLGAVLYECVSGRKAFGGETEGEVTTKVLNGSPEKMGEGVPAEVEGVIERCLEKDPRDRYSSTDEVLKELEGISQGVATGTLRGMKARRRTKRRWVPWAAGGAAALVLAAVGVGLWLGGVLGGEKEQQRITIALLPLQNAGIAADSEWLLAGLTDTLSTDLTRLRGLRVTSQSSARLVDPSISPEEAGRRLGVSHLVSGSIAPKGDQLAVSLRLSDAPTGKETWSGDFQVPAGASFGATGSMARTIARELGVTISPEEDRFLAARAEVPAEAWQAYSRARQQLSLPSDEALGKSIELFNSAIAIAPDFAMAHIGLSEAYYLMGLTNPITLYPAEARMRAFQEIRKALEIDGNLARAADLLGPLFEVSPQSSIALFSELESLAPSDTIAYICHARLLTSLCRYDEAFALLKKAAAIDPLNPRVLTTRAACLMGAGRYKEAIAQADAVLELYPDDWLAYAVRARSQRRLGDLEAAVSDMQLAADHAPKNYNGMKAALGTMYMWAGRREEAEAILNEFYPLREGGNLISVDIAELLAQFDKDDDVFKILFWASTGEEQYFEIDWWYDFPPDFKADSRFIGRAQRLGVVLGK